MSRLQAGIVYTGNVKRYGRDLSNCQSAYCRSRQRSLKLRHADSRGPMLHTEADLRLLAQTPLFAVQRGQPDRYYRPRRLVQTCCSFAYRRISQVPNVTPDVSQMCCADLASVSALSVTVSCRVCCMAKTERRRRCVGKAVQRRSEIGKREQTPIRRSGVSGRCASIATSLSDQCR